MKFVPRKRIDEAKEMKTSDEPEILAGALFIVHPQEVVYLFSGTYENINNTMHRI